MHTPGPWFLGETSHDILAKRGTPVASPCDGYDEAQWLVDGRLIAAAPDLLEACKSALAQMTTTVAPRHAFTDAVDALDAAIAKAEGR